MILYCDPISKYSVLTRFRDNLSEESHRLKFARSWLMATSTSCIDLRHLPDTVNVHGILKLSVPVWVVPM
jgi:hypothetical protein